MLGIIKNTWNSLTFEKARDAYHLAGGIAMLCTSAYLIIAHIGSIVLPLTLFFCMALGIFFGTPLWMMWTSFKVAHIIARRGRRD